MESPQTMVSWLVLLVTITRNSTSSFSNGVGREEWCCSLLVFSEKLIIGILCSPSSELLNSRLFCTKHTGLSILVSHCSTCPSTWLAMLFKIIISLALSLAFCHSSIAWILSWAMIYCHANSTSGHSCFCNSWDFPTLLRFFPDLTFQTTILVQNTA